MSHDSPNSNNPNQGRKLRIPDRIIFGSIPLLCIVLLATQTIKDPQAFGDVIHATVGTEDPREEKIRKALGSALNLEVSVHCVPAWGTQDDGAPTNGKPVSLFGIELDIIRLRDKICDDATRDINGDPSALAVMAIAHEAAHVEYDDDTDDDAESITECRAFQTAPAVARALGASQATVEIIIGNANALSSVRTAEYTPPANCVDGGPYDVYPQESGGTFPREYARQG